MRVQYITPSISQFDSFFTPVNEYNTAGGGLKDINYFRPKYYNRGGSFLSFLSSIASKALPFLKNFVLPEAGVLTSNIIDDASNNIPLKLNVKKNLIKSVKRIGRKIVRGGGKKIKLKKKQMYEG